MFFCLLYLSASTTAACYTEYMHLVTSEYTCFDLPPTLHPSAGHWHRLILDEIFQSAWRMWTKGEVPESEMCFALECMCVNV